MGKHGGKDLSHNRESLLLIRVDDDIAQEMQLPLVELAQKSCTLIPARMDSS